MLRIVLYIRAESHTLARIRKQHRPRTYKHSKHKNVLKACTHQNKDYLISIIEILIELRARHRGVLNDLTRRQTAPAFARRGALRPTCVR